MQSQEELYINHYIFKNNHVSEDSIVTIINENFVRTSILEDLFNAEDEHSINYFNNVHHIEGNDGRIFYLNFFSKLKKLVYLVDHAPRVFIDVDDLFKKLKSHIRQRRRVHGTFLAELLDSTIADVLANPILDPVVELFGINLDQRFLLRFTRDFQNKINDYSIWHSIEDIRIRTYAYEKLFHKLGNKFWGCSHYLSLCSHRFQFILRPNVLEIFESLEDARENSINLNARWENRIYDFVDLDKALPYVAYIFIREEGRLRENLYLVQSPFFEDAFSSNFDTQKIVQNNNMANINQPLSHQEISNRIPDYDGSSKSGLWSFIKVIDELNFELSQLQLPAQENAQRQTESQLRLVCMAAKRKLKGKAADLVASVPNEWATIREMLLLIYGSPKSEGQLRTDLASVTQGYDSLESFYNKIRDVLTDLITKATGNAANREEALEAEQEARQLALQAFTDGLNSNYHSQVNNRRPTSLEQAYQYAKKITYQQTPAETSTQTAQFPIEFFQQFQESLLKQVDARLNQVINQNTAILPAVSQPNIKQHNPQQSSSNNQTNSHKKNKTPSYFCEKHGDNYSHTTEQCRMLKKAEVKKEELNQTTILMTKMLEKLDSLGKNEHIPQMDGLIQGNPNQNSMNSPQQFQHPMVPINPWQQQQQSMSNQGQAQPFYQPMILPHSANQMVFQPQVQGHHLPFNNATQNFFPGQGIVHQPIFQNIPTQNNIPQNFPSGQNHGQQP